VVKSTGDEIPHNTVFVILLLISPLKPKYSAQHPILKHPVHVHVKAKSANRFATLKVAVKIYSAHSVYD
jgi:hypothetical protein